jgi:GntR family transcriptional regulator, transcriptional repressor for pyruvate dehydrogenase complex
MQKVGHLRTRSVLIENVAEELRHMILSGKFRPGDYLPAQRELATQMGVCLSTMREALQVLSAVGMVQSYPGKGTWVRSDALGPILHPETVRSRLGELNADRLCEARSVIEVAVTELAAARATPAQILEMRTALDDMKATVHDRDAFVDADLHFHLAVARAADNDLLEQFYHLAHSLLGQVITELVSLPRVMEESINLQAAILKAIGSHNVEAAREAADAHKVYIADLLGIQSERGSAVTLNVGGEPQ